MGRVAAVGALVIAVVVVAVILMSGGSSYTLRANFVDAGGLVAGNQVLMGPATVGTINSITLTPNSLAQVSMSMDSGASPMPAGDDRARLRELAVGDREQVRGARTRGRRATRRSRAAG